MTLLAPTNIYKHIGYATLLLLLVLSPTNADVDIESIRTAGLHLTRTASGSLESNETVTTLLGRVSSFTIKASGLETTCKGLTCKACDNFKDAACVTCSSRADTLTLSNDFVVGICVATIINNNQIVENDGEGLDCGNLEGLTVPHGRVLKPRAWSDCGNGKRYLKVGFVLTNRLVQSVYNDNLDHAKTAIVGMLEEVNLIYENQLKVRLEIGEIYSLRDPKRRPKPNCGSAWNDQKSMNSALNAFTSWARCVNQDHVGIWHLIDVQEGLYGSGLAYVGTMCHSSLNTGVSIYSHALWRTVAHEIGHNFNARHPMDGKQVAKDNAGIMGYGDAKVNNEYQFDTGNKEFICAKLRSVDGKCTALQTTHKAVCGNGIRESGEECECLSGTSCPCCENCKLPKEAECNPEELFSGCCSSQCKFESMAKTCNSGAGYCVKGSCVNTHPALKLCGANEETCRIGLTSGHGCIFNGFLSNSKSLHIAQDGAICKNSGTCKNGICKDQKKSDSITRVNVATRSPTPRQTPGYSPTPFPSAYPTRLPKSKNVLCTGHSVKTCDELPGFTYSENVEDTCAKSVGLSSQQCHMRERFHDAQAVCKSIGARLCTADEIEKTVGYNTGCELNGEYIWSSTPCGNQKHYVVRRTLSSSKMCVPDKSSNYRRKNLGVRCCADRENKC